MIGNRSLFVFITLLLVMVMSISTAPMYEGDNETVTPSSHNHNHESETEEEIHETTSVPDVVTNDLLFFDVTALPFDKIIKTNEGLLFRKESEVLVTPELDEPHLFHNQIFGAKDHTFNNDMYMSIVFFLCVYS
jgi:hypothetical protein